MKEHAIDILILEAHRSMSPLGAKHIATPMMNRSGRATNTATGMPPIASTKINWRIQNMILVSMVLSMACALVADINANTQIIILMKLKMDFSAIDAAIPTPMMM